MQCIWKVQILTDNFWKCEHLHGEQRALVRWPVFVLCFSLVRWPVFVLCFCYASHPWSDGLCLCCVSATHLIPALSLCLQRWQGWRATRRLGFWLPVTGACACAWITRVSPALFHHDTSPWSPGTQFILGGDRMWAMGYGQARAADGSGWGGCGLGFSHKARRPPCPKTPVLAWFRPNHTGWD